MTLYLLAALGSAAGGAARYVLSGIIAERAGPGFPWGTLLVNGTGSFAIGLFFAWTGSGLLFLEAPASHQLFTYGILGGYTTYSSFTLETLNMVREGEWMRAAWYTGGTFILCIAFVAVGFAIGELLV